MMSAKPIFLIRVDYRAMSGDYGFMAKRFQETLDNEYHVIIAPGADGDPEFQLFNATDVDESSFEELKEYVVKMLKEDG